MAKQNKKLRPLLNDSHINTIAGAVSGVFVSILVSPLDVVKTRIQVKRLPKGVPDQPLLLTMYRLARREGFLAFYKGLETTMLVRKLFSYIQLITLSKFYGYEPNCAVYFTTYQCSKKQYY